MNVTGRKNKTRETTPISGKIPEIIVKAAARRSRPDTATAISASGTPLYFAYLS